MVGHQELGMDMFQLLFGKDSKIAELNSRPHLSNDMTSYQDNILGTDFGVGYYDDSALAYISEKIGETDSPRPVVIQDGVTGVSNIFAPYIVET